MGPTSTKNYPVEGVVITTKEVVMADPATNVKRIRASKKAKATKGSKKKEHVVIFHVETRKMQ